MPFIDQANGDKTHYITTGSGDKNILFIHGNLSNTIWWEKTMEILPEEYTSYALDLPGSGHTPETGIRHTIQYLADFVKGFVDSMGLMDLTVVGHSMGGGVAQLFTLSNPGLVKGLVLLDSMSADGFHVLYDGGEERMRKAMTDYDFLTTAIRVIAPQCSDEEMLKRTIDLSAKASEQVFIEQPVTMHEANWMDRVHNITCPTLFLHGKDDHFVPQDGSERTAAAIPNCELRYIDNCGHYPMSEQPEEFYKELLEFIGTVY
ncbi:MAG: alpha/beta hydrolase [Gammaproteobacteria bacterium]|nr:MAG: alpha/beta hydrolase [Gammaproteobacteria bacterium]